MKRVKTDKYDKDTGCGCIYIAHGYEFINNLYKVKVKYRYKRGEYNNMSHSVYVVGAGAAGMMAAITAARQGKKVTIIEHRDKAGKKILATGNGKCNFTNMYMDKECFRGSNNDYIMDIYNQFDNKAVIDFFKHLGIYPKIKNGYVYPNSGQAISISEALQNELRYLNVDIITNTNIREIYDNKDGYLIITDKGEYKTDSVIIAAGSNASPKSGSDGSGYRLAKKLGHTIVPVLPALVQLRSSSPFFKEVAGVRTDGSVRIMSGRECVAKDSGELMLTDYGISGIPVFQVSRFASVLLNKNEKVIARLDFLPEMDFTECKEYIRDRIYSYPDKSIKDNFTGILNSKLLNALLKELKIDINMSTGNLSEKQIIDIANGFKNFSINITGTNSFDNAQVCCGGVSLDELNKHTLESKLHKGLFFAGEILDVDGICGGYNLQWAWSSGYVSGINC